MLRVEVVGSVTAEIGAMELGTERGLLAEFFV
jgi:hypothetical protein